MLIIRRSNCINTASGIVLSVSGRPVCRLRSSFSTCTQDKEFLLNLHTGQGVPSQPAHRTRSSFSTCAPDKEFLLNLHTGQGVPSQPVHRTVTYTEYCTRSCVNTIRPPNDEHSVVRNMYRIIII